MSSSTEERASPLRSYDGRIAYRVPKDLEAAAAVDAAREWTMVSEVARQALIARLRNRGLLREAG
jgi:predicted HicB family RNase H-like nuclease